MPRLPELDGVRGIAALLVFFHHLCSATIHGEKWSPVVLWLHDLLYDCGGLGVNIFFVLSGFLITSLLIRDRESPAFYRDFYWKRALRILPLYIVCLVGVLLFIRHSGAFVLLSALFLANFASVLHVQISSPFWTLAIEEQFYLVWPTVVRRRHISRLRNWALAIIAIVVLLRAIAAFFGHHDYNLTPLCADGLATGALLASVFERGRQQNLKPAVYTRFLLAALVAGLALWRVPSLFSLHSIAIAASFKASASTLFCGGAVGLTIAHTGNRYLGFLRSRLLTFFGLISYAFYMLHLYVMMPYDRFFPLTEGDSRAYAVRLAVVFAITVAASVLSRYLIELPALSMRKRVLSEPAPAAETQRTLSQPYDEPQEEVVA